MLVVARCEQNYQSQHQERYRFLKQCVCHQETMKRLFTAHQRLPGGVTSHLNNQATKEQHPYESEEEGKEENARREQT
jgi:hypothetical protein